MPTTDLYSFSGDVIGTIDLPDEIFGITPNTHAMYFAVRAYRNNQRQGSANTKNRSLVRGGAKKPYRQKGTGRARQGTIRSPLHVGGGKVFGPTPRDYSMKVPQKIKQLAIKSAFSTKYKENVIKVIDSIDWEGKADKPKTKEMAKFLKRLKISGKKCLLLTDGYDKNLYLSSRNIENLKIYPVNQANVYDLLNTDNLIILKNAVEKMRNNIQLAK